MSGLVLSLFPGIGLLDMAFEEEGFCVVRGPDLLWGGDVRKFHPPAGRFDGVIGGPPCKRWSALAAINRARYGEQCLAPDLIPDFARCVSDAQPQWFVMENVEGAPTPEPRGYIVNPQMIRDVWVGGATSRLRRFSFGTRDGRPLRPEWLALHRPDPEQTVTTSAGGRRRTRLLGEDGRPIGKQTWSGGELHKWKLEDVIRLQGLPSDFLSEAPFTVSGKREVIGNGVPLPMGRAVARAVKAALTPTAIPAPADPQGGVMGLYETIAQTMPKVTGLRCTVCGNTRRPRQSQIAGFLAAGWPTCCGLTMRMHTEADPLPTESADPKEGT